jgi:beta-phosphoglucomutase-like phosphatase (HAD superfamily)
MILSHTEPVYTIATQEILSEYGKTFEWSVKSRMMGQKAIDAARILVRVKGRRRKGGVTGKEKGGRESRGRERAKKEFLKS